MCIVPRLISPCINKLVRAALVAPEGATENKEKCRSISDFPTGVHEVAKIFICHLPHLG